MCNKLSTDSRNPLYTFATQSSQSNGEKDASSVKKITELMQSALNCDQNPQMRSSNISKCWDYAFQLTNPLAMMRMCALCERTFPKSFNSDPYHRYYEPFVLWIDREKIELPGYYQELLIKESSYFKALFKGEFKENNSATLTLQEFSSHQVATLVYVLVHQKLPEKEFNTSEVITLIYIAGILDLEKAALILIKTLAKSICRLEPSSQNREMIYEIYTRLEVTPYFHEPLLHEAIKKYFLKEMTSFKTDNELFEYTEKHGKEILSLDLLCFKKEINDTDFEKLISNCPNLTGLFIQNSQITNKGLRHLKNLKSLTTLGLKVSLSDEIISILRELKSLTSLDLSKSYSTRTFDVFKSLKELKNLKSLNLSSYWLSGIATGVAEKFENLPLIKKFKNLKRLDLSSLDIEDHHLDAIGSLKQLTALNLSDCRQITDKGINRLKELQNLKELYLAGCTELTSACLLDLKVLTELTKLDISSVNIRDEDIVHLKELKNLKMLDISKCWLLTNKGVVQLVELKQLKWLNLALNTQITEKEALVLKELKRLTFLNLHSSPLTDQALGHIKELKNLTSLDLSKSQLTDQGLFHLTELAKLKDLKLTYCDKLTDLGLLQLKSLPQLTNLTIWKASEKTIEAFRHLSMLLVLSNVMFRSQPRNPDDISTIDFY